MRRTHDFTSGFVSQLDAGGVEVTLGGGVFIRIDVERIVGTSLHAGLATDAALAVEVHDSVLPAEKRDRRTNFDAGRIIAVVAPQYGEMSLRVRKFALLDVFDPCAVNTNRDIVLFFAGNRAGMTANAAVLINDKTVAHAGWPL